MEEVEGLSPSISTRIYHMNMRVSDTTYEILGWIGVVFVLGSYCLLATGIISGDSWPYHALVLFGSAFIAGISLKRHNLQPFVLNVVFSILAIIALARIILL